MHSGYLSAWSHLRAIASILAAACIQKERALICEETTSALPKESNGRGMCANGLAQITTSILRRSRTIRPITTSIWSMILNPGVGAVGNDSAELPVGESTGNRQWLPTAKRSEEHTSELQSLMRTSYAVFC